MGEIMDKRIFVFLVAALFLLQIASISALSAGDAKQAWLDAKDRTQEKKTAHEDAKLARAADNTPDNQKKVVDTGKEYQYAILDEVDSWLDWKKLEAEEDSRVPDDIKQRVYSDVDANKGKVAELRTDVDAVTNEFQLGAVSLKMIGKYFELLADVARDTGAMWAYVEGTHADKIETFEGKLRVTAESMGSNADIIAKLDSAKSELEIARRNIDNAESTYELVKIPGTPFLKFAEGNSYLRAGQANLINAWGNLNQAYVMITTRGG